MDRGQRGTIAADVFDRQFQADTPKQKWLASSRKSVQLSLYVAAVLDLYSRRVAGWSMQLSMTSHWVGDALMMDVWRRGKTEELLRH